MVFDDGDKIRKLAVVRKNDQPLGVEVEPADRMQASMAFYQIGDGLSALRGRRAGKITFGFIEQGCRRVARFCELCVDQLAADLDVVFFRIGFGAELGDDLAVDGDLAGWINSSAARREAMPAWAMSF